MKIEFVSYRDPQKELEFRIVASPDEEKSKQTLLNLLRNTLESMGMIIGAINNKRGIYLFSAPMLSSFMLSFEQFIILPLDSLPESWNMSALLWNIKKRVLDSGISQENWDGFLDDIRKAGVNIEFGSKQKLDTLLPKDMRMLVADYLTGKEVARLSQISRFFPNETKQMQLQYWRKKIIAAGCGELLLNEAITTGAVTDYKVLYRVFLKNRFWIDPFEISNLGTLFCLSGDVGLVRYAIENKLVDANFKVVLGDKVTFGDDSYFLNAFALTALSGSAQCMQEAAKIPGINLDDDEGWGIYHHPCGWAACSGSAEAIREALKIPKIRENKWNKREHALNLLIFAGGASADAIQVFAEIPDFNINFYFDDGDGDYYILETAIKNSSVETIKALSKFPGINVNLKDSNGENLLMRAIQEGTPEKIRAIAEIPGLEDANARNHDGNTALELAAEYGLAYVKEVVKIPGVDLLAKDVDGNNVLHIAVMKMHCWNYEVIIFLRRLGLSSSPKIDFNTCNDAGKTPLMCINPFWDGENKKRLEEALTIEVQPFNEEVPEEKMLVQASTSSSTRFFSQTTPSTDEEEKEEPAKKKQKSSLSL